MTGANFSIGEQLSPIITRRIPLVYEIVRQVCATGLSDEKRSEILYLHAKTGT
jgi:hypothetical protein